MKRLYRARNSSEAHLLCARLVDGGITARILGESLLSAAGEVPAQHAGPEIWIGDDDQIEIARRLLHEALAEPVSRMCAKCGYDLRWLPTPRCPECGTEFRQPPRSWKCACGELIEGQFTDCWKCGASVPSEPRL